MKLKLYPIDAFTDKVFSGNPAAICPLDKWLSDELLQKITMENNLAETGFYMKAEKTYEIRWFTPTVEVDLCGHATLAAAHVLFVHEGYTEQEIIFYSPRSGELKVRKTGDMLTLNFPTDVYSEIIITNVFNELFNIKPLQVFKGKTDYMLVFENETQITALKPVISNISALPASRGVIVTAQGDTVDFVSRFFAPQSGIDEDPVTGSAHTTLTPYWAKVLYKNELSAMQLSARRGYLQCKLQEARVEISGRARTYLIGEIEV